MKVANELPIVQALRLVCMDPDPRAGYYLYREAAGLVVREFSGVLGDDHHAFNHKSGVLSLPNYSPEVVIVEAS